MPLARSQCLLYPNFARTLCYRHKHNVHQTDPANAKGQSSDKSQQNFKPECDDLELMDLGHKIEHSHGTAVGLAELVLCCHYFSSRLFKPFVFRCFIVEPNRVEIVSILKITHGCKRYIDNTIYIVVSLLHFGFQYANDFEAQPIKANVFAQSVTSREQLVFCFRADDRDPGMLYLIFGIVKAANAEFEGSDREDVGIVAGYGPVEAACFILNIGLFG